MPQADRTLTTLIPTARRVPPAAQPAPEHTSDRRSHRRRFLLDAGATLALSLGATAAVLAPDPTWGAPATDAEPDAELIAACDRYIRAMDAFEDDDSDLDFNVNPLCHAMEAAEEAAQDIPAQTMAGVIAKARVAVAMGTSRDGTVRLGNSYAGEWPGDVVRDLLRLVDGQVPA